MAKIPMTADVAALVGTAAEGVDNRSLLLDKFAFHKRWPDVPDAAGRPTKWDDASRWSFVRIADDAARLLQREAAAKRYKARGRNVEPGNRDQFLDEATIAEHLAKVSWDTRELSDIRARHTHRFIQLFRHALRDRARVVIGRLEGRLAINLADSLIQNAGMCLDRLFGCPFIPGSAVKGVTRAVGLAELQAASGPARAHVFDVFRCVFGTADNDFRNGELQPFRDLLGDRPENQKGAVAFLPAFPFNEAKIVVDLTNVHYPDYYRSGDPKDLANERPQPNPFPAVESGAEFAFCLVLNQADADVSLLQAAAQWMETALTVRGIGAKTAAGYGWFAIDREALARLAEEEAAEAAVAAAKARQEAQAQARSQAEAVRLAGLSPEQRETETLLALNDEAFAAYARALASKTEIQQRAFLQLLRGHPAKRDRWKTWKKRKPDLAKGIEAVNSTLKAEPLP